MHTLHMGATLFLVGAALLLFSSSRLRSEVVSVGILASLILLFETIPLRDPSGKMIIDAGRLLAGFGNPAVITVMALLVVSEGIIRTGALDGVARLVIGWNLPPNVAVALVLVVVMAVSGFVNDTPVVVMFLPIIRAIATHLGIFPAQVMMPLSFAALLGGMGTLIGTSTNLLASGALLGLGLPPFSLFEFTAFGVVFSLAGLVYMTLFARRLLPGRVGGAGPARRGGRQFMSQMTIPDGSPLVGDSAVAGQFPALPGMTVIALERGLRREWTPYDGVSLQPGDVLTVAASRKALAELAGRQPRLLRPIEWQGPERRAGAGEQMLVEAMIPPASRLIGGPPREFGFRHGYQCAVVGVQREPRMARQPMADIRLQVGDVLLIMGHRADIDAVHVDRDLVVISGSAEPLPPARHGRRAAIILAAAVLLAAFGILPIVATAVTAAVLMLAVGVLTPSQAGRALDLRIALIAAAGLALGEAMEATGAAAFVAHGLIAGVGGLGTTATLSALFLLVAVFTNLLSNNACALLFTPIAVNMAQGLGVDAHILAVTVVLAANCAFATPFGYQTNLLVMAPGNYVFGDYVRFGGPLVLIVWLLFTLMAPWYWGL